MKTIFMKPLSFFLAVSIALMMCIFAYAESSGGGITARASGIINEPSWKMTVYVEDYQGLTDAIKDAGTNNTSVILTDNIYTAATVDVKKDQTIKIIGGAGTFSVKTTAADISVITNAGTLWLENVIVTGGNITNASLTMGGGVTNSGVLVLADNAQILNNTAVSYGGGVYNNSALYMIGNSRISNNIASGNAGGVYNNGLFTMGDNSEVSYNTAENDGGGIYSNINNTATKLTVKGSASISYNAAGNDGGGIFNCKSDEITDNALISGNYAGRDGGGICLNANNMLNINGSAKLSGNTSMQFGGAISSYSFGYAKINSNNVVFSDNSARYFTIDTNPANKWCYDNYIKSTKWTAPFKQGYNNYDIGQGPYDFRYVTFNKNYDKNETLETVGVQYGNKLNSFLPAFPTHVRNNYYLTGWKVDKNGNGDFYKLDSVITANVTLYAQWGADKFNVTFNANGGSFSGGETIVTRVANAPAFVINMENMPVDPILDEYRFIGWNTKAEGDGEEFTDTTAVASDIQVYANWAKVEDVVGNGGGEEENNENGDEGDGNGGGDEDSNGGSGGNGSDDSGVGGDENGAGGGDIGNSGDGGNGSDESGVGGDNGGDENTDGNNGGVGGSVGGDENSVGGEDIGNTGDGSVGGDENGAGGDENTDSSNGGGSVGGDGNGNNGDENVDNNTGSGSGGDNGNEGSGDNNNSNDSGGEDNGSDGNENNGDENVDNNTANGSDSDNGGNGSITGGDNGNEGSGDNNNSSDSGGGNNGGEISGGNDSANGGDIGKGNNGNGNSDGNIGDDGKNADGEIVTNPAPTTVPTPAPTPDMTQTDTPTSKPVQIETPVLTPARTPLPTATPTVYPDKPPVKISVSLRAKLRVISDEAHPTDKVFQFSVYEDGIEVATGENDINGDILFSPILYDAEGYHVYAIKEQPSDGGGWTTDRSEHRATVKVYFVNDIIRTSVTYAHHETPVLNNIYEIEGHHELEEQEISTEQIVKNIRELVRKAHLVINPEINEKDLEMPLSVMFVSEHKKYIFGYPDGSIRPNESITRAEIASIFYKLLDDGVREYFMSHDNPYPDTDKESWYNDAVSTISKLNILIGDENGEFKPDEAITRAELAAVAARFARMSQITPYKKERFGDIEGHWAEDDINYMASAGWIDGYNEVEYSPERHVTRAEAISLVNRIFNREHELNGEERVSLGSYWHDNADPNAWYYNEIIEASVSHIK